MKTSSHSGVRQWDIDVDEDTSARLGRVRQRDTAPERILRSALWYAGHRYRLRNSDLPGRPDMANRSRKWAVFVNGCFWHQHPGCPRATVPGRNRDFWLEKFEANRRRDAANEATLRDDGYTVATVWECEIESDLKSLLRRLGRLLPPR